MANSSIDWERSGAVEMFGDVIHAAAVVIGQMERKENFFEHRPVYRIRVSRSKKEGLRYTYSLTRWPRDGSLKNSGLSPIFPPERYFTPSRPLLKFETQGRLPGAKMA